MAYDEKLADRIRETLAGLTDATEKKMFGGVAFMVHDKMCVGIIKDELMCRIDPDLHQMAIEKTGCRTMEFTGRPMKGYVMVEERGMKNQKEVLFWIHLALDFNSRAKASKRKKKR